MPIKGNFYLPPVDYYAVTGRKWQVTGFKIPTAHPDSVFIDHSTGMAHNLFSGAIQGGSGYYTTGATGIYSASGQYDSKNLTVSWDVVNPATNLIESDSALLGRYLEGFEVNFYDETGKFYTGINFVDNGSITKVDLLAGGSGYLNPTVIVTGARIDGGWDAPSGTGAYIEVKTLGSGLHKSGDIFSMPESGLGYLSGIYHVNIISGGSGYTQDSVLLITGSGDSLTEPGMGSGADLRINNIGLGKRYGYSSSSQITIPHIVNREIFGGTAKRKYQVEVIAVDYYNQRSTGRLMVDFPKPKIGNVELVGVSDGVSFKVNPPTKTFQGKKFENISLQDIAIYRDEAQDFEIKNEIGDSNYLTSHRLKNVVEGSKLSSLGQINIGSDFFTADDAFRGYYYKFLPVDNFGTGDPVSYSTGIRVNATLSVPDTPSGFKLVVDSSKTVGTNIEGQTFTNTYLTWKKDRLFSSRDYEIVLDDDVEKESHILTCTAPGISGIDFMMSGIGANEAAIDQETFIPLPPVAFPRKMFDIFSPYGAAGLSWVDHTIILDEKYLPKFGNSFNNTKKITVAAGNTTSGYLYFSGNNGYTTTYVADNRLLEDQGVALVARNINNEALVEYEPRVKIPTQKDGKYSIKVRAFTADDVSSVYSEKVVFTASGDSSHFAFVPGTSQLRLGGTGDITVSGNFATTVGGSGIVAVGDGIVVVGGVDNRATGEAAALVGGSGNRLIGNTGDPQEGHFLGGGALNTGSGQYTAIVGGFRNSAQGHASFLGGGLANYIPHDPLGNDSSTATSYSLIGGGMYNTVSGTASIVMGGRDNKIGTNAAIGETTATRFVNEGLSDSAYSTIAGGQDNEIYATNSFVGGGQSNIIFGGAFAHATNILGGTYNIISGTASHDGGAILGGTYNKLIDAGTALAGGAYSSGTADYTLALGTRSWAAHKGAFVLSDSLIPSAEADGTIAKKSHGEDTLNLFFENGAYLRNGSLYISGDLHVSGSTSFAGGGGSIDGAGTAGYVASWTDANTIQTGGLYNLAGGNVGIGVITPQATLQVNGDTSISGELRVANNTGFHVTSEGNVGEFRMKGGRILFVDNSAYSNDAYISMASNNRDVDLIRVTHVSEGAEPTSSPDYGGSIRYMGSRSTKNNSLAIFMHQDSDRADLEVMTFDQRGKVAIGGVEGNEVKAEALLQVSGDASITGELKVAGSIGVSATTVNHAGWTNTVTLDGNSSAAFELAKSETLYGWFGVQGAGSNHAVDVAHYQAGAIRLRTSNSAGSATDQFIVDGDATQVTGDLRITDKIVHGGDTDTYTSFTADRWELYAGGVQMIDAKEVAAGFYPTVKIGGSRGDVNLAVGSAASDGTNYLLWAEATNSNVGINVTDANDIEATLQVSGDVSITGELRVDNNTLVVDAANDRVGIGTSSPTTKLHVGILGTAADPAIGWGTDGRSQGLFAPVGENAIGFSVNQGEVVRISSAGKVGIGTNNPQELLHIDGASPRIRLRDDDAAGTPLAHIDASDGALKIQADSSNETANSFLTLEVDGSEHVRVMGAKVGIGRTAPTGKLHIYQSGDSQPAFLVEGSQGSLFSVEDSLTGSLMSVNDIAGLPVFEAFDDGTIVMGQYNSGDFIVTGNSVGIGTNNPAALLDVYKGDSKFQVDPNNNRIRLRDHAYVSGNLYVSGAIVTADGTSPDHISGLSGYFGKVGIGTTKNTQNAAMQVKGDAYFIDQDSDDIIARIRDSADDGIFELYANNVVTTKIFGGGDSYIGYNGHLAVGMSASASAVPTATLTVDGDASITGELRVDGFVGIGVDPDGIGFRAERSINGNWAGLIKNTHSTNGYGLKVQGGDDSAVTSFRVADVSNNALLEVQGGGNVGIGTISPGRKLTVSGNVGDNLPVRIMAGDSATKSHLEFQDPTTTADYKVTIGSVGDDFSIQAGGSEKMRVANGGEVGIGGTGQRGALFTVHGDASITGQLKASEGIGLKNGYSVHWDNENTRILASHSSDYMRFDVGGISKILYLAGGKAGIGGAWNSNPQATLSVSGDASITGELKVADDIVITGAGKMLDIWKGSSTNPAIQIRSQASSAVVVDTDKFGQILWKNSAYTSDNHYGELIKQVWEANSHGSFGSNSQDYIRVRAGGAGDNTLEHVLGSEDFIIRRISDTGRYAFRVSNMGQVGIGEFGHGALEATLSVSGDASITGELRTAGNIKISNAQPFIYFDETDSSTEGAVLSAGGNMYIDADRGAVGGKFIRFRSNGGTNLVTMEAGGNVGIGTTDPDANLHVYGGASSVEPHAGANQLVVEDNGTLGISILGGTGNSARIYFGSAGSNGARAGRIDYNLSTDLMQFGTADTQSQMVIDSAGLVGIGTDSPDGPLHIQYNDSTTRASVANNTTVGLQIENTNNAGVAQIHLRAGDGDAHILVTDEGSNATDMFFSVDGTEAAMVIKNNGSVGIGTTIPQAKLAVNGNASITGELTTNDRITIKQSADNDGLRLYGYDDVAAHYAEMYITSAGNCYFDSTYRFYFNLLNAGGIGIFRYVGSEVAQWNNLGFKMADNRQVSFGAGVDFYIKHDNTNDVLKIYDAGAVDGITLDNLGRAGIGTARPSGRLHVNNDGTGIIVANAHITGNAFEVHGAQGNLLTITDDLSDSLMSVNDAAGMPVFEVFADDTIKSYRNNESKFEIDPDNNRIRLRDHVYISGDLIVSGDITSTSASHESTSYTASTHVSGLSGYFGKVGIGTTSILAPTATLSITDNSNTVYGSDLDVVADTVFINAPKTDNSDNQIGASIAFGLAYGGYGLYRGASIAAVQTDADVNVMGLSFYTSASTNTNNTVAEAMRIEGDGKVAIGTNNPDGSLLRVNGDVGISGELKVKNNTYWLDPDTTDVIAKLYDSSDDGVFDVYRNNSPTIRLHGNGDSFIKGGTASLVGIGTAAPTNAFHVKKDIDDFIVKIENDGNAAAAGGLHLDTRWNVEGNYPLKVTTNSESKSLFAIDAIGRVLIGGGVGGDLSAMSTLGGNTLLTVSGDASISGELKTSGNLIVYRDNGMLATDTVFEVEPNNNRIRLRDHTYVSGNLYVSGAIVSADDATNDYVSGLSGYFGKVGIGTTEDYGNSTARLTVGHMTAASVGDTMVLHVIGGAGGTDIAKIERHSMGYIAANVGGGHQQWKYVDNGGNYWAAGRSDNHNAFCVAYNSNLLGMDDGTKFNINTNGDVLIGEGASQAGAKLTVSGDASITGELKVAGNIIPKAAVLKHTDSANQHFGGGSATNNGSNFIMYGGSHASYASQLHFRVAGVVKQVFDENGNVGIGTSAPNRLLHLRNDTSTVANKSQLRITNANAAGDAYIYLEGSKDWSFGVDASDDGKFKICTTNDVSDGTEIMTFQKDGLGGGEVGIGTTVPTGRMHIYQSGDAIPAFLVEGSQGSLFSVEDSLTGSLMSVNDIAGLPVFEAFDDGTIVMGQYNSGDLVVSGNKVGIGTYSPSAAIEIKNSTDADAVGHGLRLTRSNENTYGELYITNVTHGSQDPIILHHSFIGDVMIWGRDGNVQVPNGKLAVGTNSPTALLTVDGDASITGELRVDSTLGVGGVTSEANVVAHFANAGGAAATAVGIDGLHASLYIDRSSTSYDANVIYRTNATNKWRLAMMDGDNYLTVYDDINDVAHTTFEAGGNVGIGTNNPAALLDVYKGDSKFQVDPNSNRIRLRDHTYVSGNLYVSGAIISADDATNDHVSGLSGYFGKVGIGTTSDMMPGTKLHIFNGAGAGVAGGNYNLHHDDVIIEGDGNIGINLFSPATSYQYLAFGDPSSANAGYVRYYHGDNSMVFRTAGSDQVHIKSDGKVGVGIATPQALLVVDGDASITGELALGRNLDWSRAAVSPDILIADNNSQALDIAEGSNIYQRFITTNSAEAVYFGKNVGIGTANPGNPLQVEKSSSATSISNAQNDNALKLSNYSTAANGQFVSLGLSVAGTAGASADAVIANFYGSAGNSNLTFHTEASNTLAERMRIDSTATQITGDLRVARFIKHGGDEGTKIDFGSTEIDLFANEIKGISVKTTEVAINDNSADVNFRVESDNSENMIFVDAGNDLVGFGTPSPSPSFTVTISGGLAADYKSFVINHPDPDKPNKDLVHGSSETDEHNVFVRGRAQSKIIDLPDYWPHLIHEHSITVQLTPIGDHQELYVESVKDNRILINNKKQNKINCFYLVHAERKDIGKLEVEPDKCNKE